MAKTNHSTTSSSMWPADPVWKEPRVTLAVSLPESVLADLDLYCEMHGRLRGYVAAQIIVDALAKDPVFVHWRAARLKESAV